MKVVEYKLWTKAIFWELCLLICMRFLLNEYQQSTGKKVFCTWRKRNALRLHRMKRDMNQCALIPVVFRHRPDWSEMVKVWKKVNNRNTLEKIYYCLTIICRLRKKSKMTSFMDLLRCLHMQACNTISHPMCYIIFNLSFKKKL